MAALPGTDPQPDAIVHASCVALRNSAVLICGASGRGKSSLALELMSRGARLISDDRTCLILRPRGVIAYAPRSLLGMIEARCIGILRADPAAPTRVDLILDLDQTETTRMPTPKSRDLLGQSVPLVHKTDSAHFPAAILQYLLSGPWTKI